MSLMSWRYTIVPEEISTVLEYFLVSSSCHVFLPFVVRPMMTIQENVLEDCLLFSRFQSLHRRLEVDIHDEEDESILGHFIIGD